MKNYSLIKLAGLALAATLVFTGCGSGGDDTVLGGGGGVAATGGGGTTAGATTGFGITGGSLTGGFGGTGGGSAGSAFTGSSSGSSGSNGTGGNNGFLGAVTPTDVRTGLNNPTAFGSITIGGTLRTVVVDGFNLAANNGRLLVIDQEGVFNPATGGFPLIPVTASGTSPLQEELDAPFDMIQGLDNDLYISVGFDIANEGRIIKVDNFQQTGGTITADYTDITALTTPRPFNPSYMTFVGNINGNDYIYYTQYTSGAGALVRRVSTDGLENDDVVNNLNFPAGIDHDGSRLAICDQAGGINGQILLAPLIGNIVSPANSDSLTEVTPAAGQQAIARPLDVDYDGNNGFFYTEGGAIAPTGFVGPAPLGTAAGTVRFIPRNSSIAQLVSSGLTNCAGIDAADPDNDGTAAVLFAEAVFINGRILRRQVNTSSVSDIAPSVVDTGINQPFFVGIGDEDIPVLAATINYFGGVNNGLFRIYTP